MKTTTRSTSTRLGVAAFALAGLMLFATACGGSSSKSSSSDGSTATTAKSSGGGSGASCVELAAKFDAASAKLDAMSASGSTDFGDVYKTMDGLTSSMPSAIKGDWKTVVEYFKKLTDAMKGIDLNNLANDPTAFAKMTDAMAGLDDAKYTTAIANVENFFAQKCPGFN